MRKLLLLAAAGALTTGTQAQQKMSISPVEKSFMTTINAPELVTLSRAMPNTGSTPSAKTAADSTRWYNAAESTGEANGVTNIYDTSHAVLIGMWQDSTVTYTQSNTGISWLSMGQVFHPQSPLFNDQFVVPANANAMKVEQGNSYIIDSIRVMGRYERTSSAYVDTLIFTVVAETSLAKFFFPQFGGSVFTNHNVDSFAAQLFSLNAYANQDPINQVAYGTSGNFLDIIQIKVPLDDNVFADSTTDGLHIIGIAPNDTVGAGLLSGVSVTFKSGTTYTAGTPIDDYNYFAFLSHETQPSGYVFYAAGDLNMSSIVSKDTTNWTANATLGYYIPTIAYTAPFRPELHNVSFKVSCPTCISTSIENVESAILTSTAYPNPANETLHIPVQATAKADVSVTLFNTVGQVVAHQVLGKMTAGEKKTAEFNTAELPSGIYIYTVTANGQRTTGRVSVAH